MKTLEDYQPVIAAIMAKIANDTSFKCSPPLHDVLADNKRMIIALSHSTPLSWLPSAGLLALKAAEAGGATRIPMGVMDNFFFEVPGIREIARYITQTSRSLSYFEISERYETRGDVDLVVFPEGSNCFFGPSDTIQEFRSSKFVELAIKTNSPILIGVHTGSEGWAKTLEVPVEFVRGLKLLPNFVFDFVEKRIKKTGLFVMPLLPLPMAHFKMQCELYMPELRLSELSQKHDERVAQIKAEGAKVRARMQAMLAELRSESAKEKSEAASLQ